MFCNSRKSCLRIVLVQQDTHPHYYIFRFTLSHRVEDTFRAKTHFGLGMEQAQKGTKEKGQPLSSANII
jgi:hypothetical protein